MPVQQGLVGENKVQFSDSSDLAESAKNIKAEALKNEDQAWPGLSLMEENWFKYIQISIVHQL